MSSNNTSSYHSDDGSPRVITETSSNAAASFGGVLGMPAYQPPPSNPPNALEAAPKPIAKSFEPPMPASTVRPTTAPVRTFNLHPKTVTIIAVSCIVAVASIWGIAQLFHHKQPVAQLNSTTNQPQDLSALSELTINGNTSVQGDLTVKGVSFMQTGLRVIGDGTFKGLVRSDTLDVNGATTIGGPLSAKDTVVSSITVGGSAKFNGVVVAPAFVGDGSKLTGISAGSSTCANCALLQPSPASAQAGNIHIGGNLLADGSIGVGTSNPGASLEVTGLSRFDGGAITGDITPVVAGTGTAAIHSNLTTNVIGANSDYAGEYGTALGIGSDGLGQIAYNLGDDYGLFYAHCTTKDCTSRSGAVTLVPQQDSNNNWLTVWNVSLVDGSDGFARIVYTEEHYDTGLSTWITGVHMALCEDLNCDQYVTQIIQEDSTHTYGNYSTSIAIGPDGFPRIAYDESTNNTIRLARCTNDSCSSPIITSLTSGNLYEGYYQSIGLSIGSDGFPRLAYLSSSDRYLHLIRCTDANCTSPIDTAVDYDNGDYPGYYGITLKTGTDGLPKIAYQDEYENLIYIDCSDEDCTSPGLVNISGSGNSYGIYNGVAFTLDSNGLPRFNFDKYTGDYGLEYVACQTTSCSQKTNIEVDPTSYAAYYGDAIAIDSSGGVHMLYSDDGVDYTLHYAYLSPATQASITGGTNIGSNTNPFGQVYTQAATVKTQLTTADILPITSGSVTKGASASLIDSTSDAGSYATGMATGPDGFARISYYDYHDNVGKFMRCLDSDCSSKKVTVYDSSGEPYYTSMAMGSDGFARIAYGIYNGSNYELRLARCTDIDCTSPVLTTVTLGSSSSNFSPADYGTSIVMGLDGLPRILSFNYDGNRAGSTEYVRFFQCLNADCSTNNFTDFSAYAGEYQNMGLTLGADGFARLAFMDPNNETLQYVRCTNSSCSSNVVNTVDSNGSSYPGYYGISMVMGQDGLPVIAYTTDDSYYHLKVAKCQDDDCASSTISTVAPTDGYQYLGIAMVLNSQGNPVISYEGYGNHYLYAAVCTAADCSSATSVLVDPTSYAMGYGIAMALDSSGNPIFVYSDYDGVGLHYARFTSATGQNLVVQGTSIGSQSASFGSAYLQNLTINQGLPNEPAISITHSTTNATSFLLNQLNTSGQTALLADFQLNGVSVASLDNSGHLTVASCTGCGVSDSDAPYVNTWYSNSVVIGNNAEPCYSSVNGVVAVGPNADDTCYSNSYNTAIGEDALWQNGNSGGTSQYNVAVGFSALAWNKGGADNTGLGTYALQNGYGDNNTAVGYQALNSNYSGSNNTAIGYGADVNSSSLTNATAIGYNAKVSTSNALVLGSNANVGIGNSSPANLLSLGTLATPDSSAQLALSTGGTGNKGIVIQAVSSQSADLFQIQSSSGSVLVKIDANGNLTAKSVTINGHVITGNSSGSTAAAAGANAGTGASCSVTGNDSSGYIQITTGTSPTAGALCVITFANSYGSSPNVVVEANSSAAAGLQQYVTLTGNTSFTVKSSNAPAASTAYQYFYLVQQ